MESSEPNETADSPCTFPPGITEPKDLGGKFIVVSTSYGETYAGKLFAVENENIVLTDARQLLKCWSDETSVLRVARHGLKGLKVGVSATGTTPILYLRKWREISPCSEEARENIESQPETSHSVVVVLVRGFGVYAVGRCLSR